MIVSLTEYLIIVALIIANTALAISIVLIREERRG